MAHHPREAREFTVCGYSGIFQLAQFNPCGTELQAGVCRIPSGTGKRDGIHQNRHESRLASECFSLRRFHFPTWTLADSMPVALFPSQGPGRLPKDWQPPRHVYGRTALVNNPVRASRGRQSTERTSLDTESCTYGIVHLRNSRVGICGRCVALCMLRRLLPLPFEYNRR